MSSIAGIDPRSSESIVIGRVYRGLLASSLWIRRRIDSISFVDDENQEHKVTFDIDFGDVETRFNATVLASDDQIPIPLLALDKQVMLDVDVRSGNGTPLPVALSSENSQIAIAMLLSALVDGGYDLSRMPESVLVQIRSVTLRPGKNFLLDIFQSLEPSYSGWGERVTSVELSSLERECWWEILDINEFVEFLIAFSETFLFIVLWRPEILGIDLIKVRFVEKRVSGGATDKKQQLLAVTGLKAQSLLIPLSGLGRAQSNHVRIYAPVDSFVSRAVLSARSGKPINGSAQFDSANVSPGMTILKVSGIDPGEYEAVIGVRPIRRSFLGGALLSVLLMAIMACAAAYLQCVDGRFSVDLQPSNTTSVDGIVAVFALVPSLIGIYLIRDGEHRIVTKLLGVQRTLLLFASCSMILASAATAANVSSTTLKIIYFVTASVTIAASLNIFAAWIISGRVYRKRVKHIETLAAS